MMGKRESKNVRSFISLALAVVMIFGSFFDFGTAKTAFAAKKTGGCHKGRNVDYGG